MWAVGRGPNMDVLVRQIKELYPVDNRDLGMGVMSASLCYSNIYLGLLWEKIQRVWEQWQEKQFGDSYRGPGEGWENVELVGWAS